MAGDSARASLPTTETPAVVETSRRPDEPAAAAFVGWARPIGPSDAEACPAAAAESKLDARETAAAREWDCSSATRASGLEPPGSSLFAAVNPVIASLDPVPTSPGCDRCDCWTSFSCPTSLLATCLAWRLVPSMSKALSGEPFVSASCLLWAASASSEMSPLGRPKNDREERKAWRAAAPKWLELRRCDDDDDDDDCHCGCC